MLGHFAPAPAVDVPRVNHARQFDVHRPLQRAVHLRRNVVAPWRLAYHFEFRNGFCPGHAGGGVDIVSGKRDVELFSAD